MKSGILYDDFKKYFGQDSQDVLLWRASSKFMNPSIEDARLCYRAGSSRDDARQGRCDASHMRAFEFCRNTDPSTRVADGPQVNCTLELRLN